MKNRSFQLFVIGCFVGFINEIPADIKKNIGNAYLPLY